MRLEFHIAPVGRAQRSTVVEIDDLVIAGWAGRDRHAVQHHIDELAALGVRPPSTVPLFYRVAASQLTQAPRMQVVGAHSSGEAEVFLFRDEQEPLVSLVSDHTDRQLEAHSVALSKQVCGKPVGRSAWPLADVAPHWDRLLLRSWIVEDGQRVLYQEGPLAALRLPQELADTYARGTGLPPGCAMSCGTVTAIGGIRPSSHFVMELADPVHGRTLRHEYGVDLLPEVA